MNKDAQAVGATLTVTGIVGMTISGLAILSDLTIFSMMLLAISVIVFFGGIILLAMARAVGSLDRSHDETKESNTIKAPLIK